MKKRIQKKKIKLFFLFIEILIILLTAALVPLNIFVCNFPEWFVIIFGITAITVSIFYVLKFRVRIVSRIINIALTACISILSVLAAYAVPYWNSYSLKKYNGKILGYDDVITYTQAENDIDEAMKLLKRIHPMFKDGLTDEIASRCEQSKEKLKNSDEINVNDLRRELQSIINPMHDAHTTTYNSYPNDRYLRSAPQKSYEKYELISFNDMTIDEAKAKAKAYFSYESESWIKVDFGSLASLDFYNFSEPYIYEWDNGSGEIVREECCESDFVPYDEYVKICSEFDEEVLSEKPFVYYEIDEEKNLAILTLSKCIYDKQYIKCIEDMFNEIKEKNIGNVAVDLRNNGGGNSLVANEFIKYLPVDEYKGSSNDWRFNFITLHSDDENTNKHYSDLTFTGDVYVITNSSSFSSAMLFSMYIQDNKLGSIIGESPANSANSYGDIAIFNLKETGLTMSISTKKFKRANSANPSDYIIPDFPCDSKDALETLYSIISQQ